VFLGGVEVRAYYFGRGHTNGDAVIYFPELRVARLPQTRAPRKAPSATSSEHSD
jgi:hypothetical protein